MFKATEVERKVRRLRKDHFQKNWRSVVTAGPAGLQLC